MNSNHVKWSVIGFSLVMLALWLFPFVWYTSTDRQTQMVWLTEQQQMDGWQYEELPVAKSAEAVLVADQLVSGQFKHDMRDRVQVFSAKRYTEKENHIGLFVHTPDRCWTESGWQLEPASPAL
ncbi:MAG TPA: exosortase-associated EpsI family protein, partial [Verrucomicrobiota bacterium]|nr:exosortase-associated EpsI family protein [Verrucomicrobiota bacterium]